MHFSVVVADLLHAAVAICEHAIPHIAHAIFFAVIKPIVEKFVASGVLARTTNLEKFRRSEFPNGEVHVHADGHEFKFAALYEGGREILALAIVARPWRQHSRVAFEDSHASNRHTVFKGIGLECE